jgi:FkbM family methyltransferase
VGTFVSDFSNRVWQKIARVHPEIKKENFSFDDPWMMEGVAEDIWKYSGKLDSRVLDIGANRGVFSVLCALNGSSVVAYEPHPETYQELLKTIRNNGVSETVIPIEKAVASHSGRMELIWGGNSVSGSLITEKQIWEPGELESRTNTRTVDLVAFEDAVGDAEWDCVKVDIEGAEFELFANAAAESLKKIKFLTMECHNNVPSQELYIRFTKRLEEFFIVEGIKDGDPRHVPNDRWISIYATRR